MYFAYLDEAGNTGQNLRDPHAPIHLIGALLVPEDRISALFAAVDRIALDAAETLGTSVDAEFHGIDLASGKAAFKGKAVSDRLEILEALARLPGEFELDIYFRGVDKARLADRYVDPYHPHDVALMFMIETIERRAKRTAALTGDSSRVLLVADEIRDRSGVIVRDVNTYQQTGTAWGWDSVGHSNTSWTQFISSHRQRIAACNSPTASHGLHCASFEWLGRMIRSIAVLASTRRFMSSGRATLGHARIRKIWHP